MNQTQTKNSMKSKFDSFMPLLVILIGGLAYSTYNLHRECVALKQKAKDLEYTAAHIGQHTQTSTVVSTDKGDLTVVTTEPMKATDKVIEARHGDDLKVVKEVGVKPKDVDAMSHVETSTRDSVTAPVKVEPFGGLSTHFKDDFTTIDVRIDSMRTAFITYEVTDSIVIVETRKRHSILFGLIKWKSKKGKVEAFSKNPKCTVKSLQVLERLE